MKKPRYIREYCSNHPASSTSGYVYKHRLVMEKALGRYLSGTEIVHHIDGDKYNNNLSNLMLLSSRTDHIRIHAGWKKIGEKWFKRCSRCKKLLEVSKENFCILKNGTPVNICRDCGRVVSQMYKEKNRDKIREKQRRYNEKFKERYKIKRQEKKEQEHLRKQTFKGGGNDNSMLGVR